MVTLSYLVALLCSLVLLYDRMQKELTALAPSTKKIKIIAMSCLLMLVLSFVVWRYDLSVAVWRYELTFVVFFYVVMSFGFFLRCWDFCFVVCKLWSGRKERWSGGVMVESFFLFFCGLQGVG